MSQLDRDWGEVVREAYDAVDDATRLNPGAFGELVELITERITLREEPAEDHYLGIPLPPKESQPKHYLADHCPFCGAERSFSVREGASHWGCSDCLPAGSRVGGAVEWVMLMDDVGAAEAVRRLRARGWLKSL